MKRRTSGRAILTGFLVIVSLSYPVVTAYAAAGDSGSPSFDGFNKRGKIGVAAKIRSKKIDHGQAKSTGPVVSSVDCGVITTGLTGQCFGASPCPAVNGKPVHTFQTVTHLVNGHDVISSTCGVAPAALTAAEIRAQVVRIVPSPEILRAPPSSGIALVHVDVIYWIGASSGYQVLTPAVLLGHRVTFRVAPKTTHWTFGDGHAATSVGAGRPYDVQLNPCRTPQCPGYFEHAYATKGDRTVTATATWRAQYQLDGGAWTDLGLVPGRQVTIHIHIYAARSILVDPSH